MHFEIQLTPEQQLYRDCHERLMQRTKRQLADDVLRLAAALDQALKANGNPDTK